MAEPWTERHRPTRLSAVVGNAQAVADLRAWAESWRAGRPTAKAALLAGPPGTGKTSAAHALAAEYGWGVVELNASDARSGPALRRVAGLGSLHHGFSASGEFQSAREGRRTLIVLDEADNLYERSAADEMTGEEWSDRGGKRAIVETVAETRQPIVLIVNDAYALTRGTGERLARHVVRIPFRRAGTPTIRKMLREIATREGVVVTDPVLDALAARAHGDLRSAVNDLEAVAHGRSRVETAPTQELGERNRTESAFDAVAAVLKGTDLRRAVEAARDLDEPPDFFLAWLDENVPAEYRSPRDLAAAYDALSRADVFLGRAMRRQQFALWGYATELMAGGVAAAKSQPYTTPPHYQFPGWIRRMGASKGSRGVRDHLARKLGALTHMGADAVVARLLPQLRAACGRDPALTGVLAFQADLDEDEITCLLGDATTPTRVQSALEDAERRRDASASSTVPAAPPRPGPTDASASGRKRRATLGDF